MELVIEIVKLLTALVSLAAAVLGALRARNSVKRSTLNQSKTRERADS